MKTILRVATLSVGLTTLVWWMVREGGKANAEDIPTFTNLAPTVAQTPADAKPSGSREAEVDGSPAAPLEAPAASPGDEGLKPAPAKPGLDPVTNPAMPEMLNPSPALAEVIKLIQAGVSEDVLMAYITNSTEAFDISSSDILYLHDLGAPPAMITTMIQHDSSPEVAARRQVAGAVKPLPAGVALNAPAPNIYPQKNAPQPANNPPEPTPVNPPPVPSEAPSADASGVDPVAGFDQPVNVSYFYTELAPYGSWVDLPSYGLCWRPTVAVWNSTWRPYGDAGRWLWTDCGWYWHSDYSWGWAPFHYGRWSCPAGIGWVWVPDSCWGPAWVSWRYTSSHCGWAPLPPSARFIAGHGFYHNTVAVGLNPDFGLAASAYVFVPFNRFTDRRPSHYYLASSHASAVFRDSKVVNNYVTVDRTTIVNHGVGFDRIAQATRGNIRQVALKGTTQVRHTNPRREFLDSDGKTLTIVRPPAPASAILPPSRPVSAVSHLRPRPQPVVASEPAVNRSTFSPPAPASRPASHVQLPGAAPIRYAPIGAKAEPVRLVKPLTPGVPIVAGGAISRGEAAGKIQPALNGSEVAANAGSSPREIHLPAATVEGRRVAPAPGPSFDERLRQRAETRPSPAPGLSRTPIARPPEAVPPTINIPAPAPVPAPAARPAPAAAPPPAPLVPSAPVPAPRQAAPPAPRAESSRPPTVVSPPSHSAPAPSRSEPASHPSRPASNDGGRRGNR